jgi:uncharacterized protein
MSRAICGKSCNKISGMKEQQKQTDDTPTGNAPSSPQFVAATQPSYAHTLFLGSDGLRPGWGLAFYVVAFLALQRLALGLSSLSGRRAGSLTSDMLEEFGSLVAAVIPSLVLARAERRSWKVYGLSARQAFGRLFWHGVAWGIAAVSLLMIALRGAHGFAFGHLVLHGERIAKYAAFWALMFLLVGLFEEFLFRGYSQFALARGVRFWPAAVVLSSTFGLVHLRNGGEQWTGALAAACIGLFFCLTLRRTGALWFAVGFHAAWDWGESFLYSVPDSGMRSPGHLLGSSLHGPVWLSGGSVGPEGSVLCFIVIAIAWAIFERSYPPPASSKTRG